MRKDRGLEDGGDFDIECAAIMPADIIRKSQKYWQTN